MNNFISISEMSKSLSITSRTLRYWESQGLFSSHRDAQSGWRLYDREALICIHITKMLRELEIPIKDIKHILDHKSVEAIGKIMMTHVEKLDDALEALKDRKAVLRGIMTSISMIDDKSLNHSLLELHDFISQATETVKKQGEDDHKMHQKVESLNEVRFINLPEMRMIYNTAVSESPEEEAINPVIEWVKTSGLDGASRLFGSNEKPFPSRESKVYGYGMYASVPKDTQAPKHLKTMDFPGGLYAVLHSTEDVFGSWQKLMRVLEASEKYESDPSRKCLEEHIRNDTSEDENNLYDLILCEPIKKK